MDEHTAKELRNKLKGMVFGGWQIEDYINHGKSALVFFASKDSQRAALKVFDPETVERYGHDVQLKRIERELSLIGKSHPNLVQVYGGGEENGFLFVVMEYFDGKNLAEKLLEVPMSSVRSLISQIAQAAKFLEEMSFAHRDIKPENIAVSSDMKLAKLLDFGVIRPLDLSNITDGGDQRYFVGTLQYSPPELLFREEEESIEAWRAITFYQLGAVLYDLLMKKQLFCEFINPYSRLVRAVEKEIPLVDNPAADPDLRLLAQNCLTKLPGNRLDTVKWEDFSKPKDVNPLDIVRKRIAQRRIVATQVQEDEINVADLYNRQIFTLGTLIFSSAVSAIKTERLPRYSTQKISAEKPFMLRILFEPSIKDGLKHYMAVYFQGEVVDPKAKIHEIRTWACISTSAESVPEKPLLLDQCRLAKGALIEQDIKSNVQECLLYAYAEALDLEYQEHNICKWLEIGSEL